MNEKGSERWRIRERGFGSTRYAALAEVSELWDKAIIAIGILRL